MCGVSIPVLYWATLAPRLLRSASTRRLTMRSREGGAASRLARAFLLLEQGLNVAIAYKLPDDVVDAYDTLLADIRTPTCIGTFLQHLLTIT
eukprot:9041036-Pyramimonas_sp.AAC.1